MRGQRARDHRHVSILAAASSEAREGKGKKLTEEDVAEAMRCKGPIPYRRNRLSTNVLLAGAPFGV